MRMRVNFCGHKRTEVIDGNGYLIAVYESPKKAQRAAALWNAAEEKNLKTEDIRAGIIQHALDGLEIAKGIIDAYYASEKKLHEKIKRLEEDKVAMLHALEAIKTELDAELFCPICERARGGHRQRCPGRLVNVAIKMARETE